MKPKCTLLDSCRVLDLADEKGLLCGKILGDLGADVIKVEPPGGGSSRKIGPFYHDEPDADKSLFWLAYNSNKRGITLDIASFDGKELLRRLVKTADFVIESFAPGYLDKLGLGYASLSEINPRIIMASITPFGQTGPGKDLKADDLVCWAMGGQAYLSGDPDRAPLQVGLPQAFLNGAIQAAAAMMIAHYDREMSGAGQYIDVSTQEAVMSTLMNARQYWEISGISLKRSGCYRQGYSEGALIRAIWQCRDGFVNLTIMGGSNAPITIVPLVKWMQEEGAADEFLLSRDWNQFDPVTATQDLYDRIERPVARFLLRYTAVELYEQAVKRSFILYPVYHAGDIVADPQLSARGYFEHVDYPGLGTELVCPGAFFKSSEADGGIRRRAPLAGEHNREIYETELGLSPEQLATLKQANVI